MIFLKYLVCHLYVTVVIQINYY